MYEIATVRNSTKKSQILLQTTDKQEMLHLSGALSAELPHIQNQPTAPETHKPLRCPPDAMETAAYPAGRSFVGGIVTKGLTQKAKADNRSAAGVATPQYKHSISIMVMCCRMLKQAVAKRVTQTCKGLCQSVF
jgi:hypothetical protein